MDNEVLTGLCEKLASHDMPSGSIALRGAQGRYSLAVMKPGAAVEISERSTSGTDVFSSIFSAMPDVRGIALMDSQYAREVAAGGKPMPASLDDMAQIVGLKVRIAKDDAGVLPCLKHCCGCFLAGKGLVAVGRTPNETFTAALVLEKGARTHILAKKLGGAKPLGFFSAKLMNIVYKKKYSQLSIAKEDGANG